MYDIDSSPGQGASYFVVVVVFSVLKKTVLSGVLLFSETITPVE
jgi:hypothetical protein